MKDAYQTNKEGDNIAADKIDIKKGLANIEMSNPKENVYTGVSYIKIFWIVILGIAIFWGLSLLSYFVFGFSVDEKDIILVFMGALTTFILLSNYAQVKEIKDQMEQERRDMRKFIDNVEKEIMNKISKEDLARFRSELFQANPDYRNYIAKMFNQNKEDHGRTKEE